MRKFLKETPILFACLLLGQASAHADPEAIPGQFLVRINPSVITAQSQLPFRAEHEVIPGSGIYLVQRPIGEKAAFATQSLASLPGVLRVEPNYIYHAVKTPDDPDYGKLWGLHNTGQVMKEGKPPGVPGVDIDAERAWEIQTGSKELIVGVVDTGIDYRHPDLTSNIWMNEAEKNGKPGVDDDGDGLVDDIYGYDFATNAPDPIDDNGHGTHVAGTIGASGNDGKGIVGVAWTVRLMALKFLDSSGHGSLDTAIRAIDFGVKHGARILNNSWSGPGSVFLEEAIQRASQAGVLFVVAAGNDSLKLDVAPAYPASYEIPNILSVAALTNQGELAAYSNFGRRSVHVAAPGSAVYSSVPGPEGYKLYSGTSMATPHVSGIAALVWSNEPQLTMEQVKERIIKTARPLDGLRNKVISGGMANAYYALTNQTPPPSPNNPVTWQTVPFALESAHPYADRITQEFRVSVANADDIAVHFKRFSLETAYDRVYIYTGDGKFVGYMTGEQSDGFSPVIPGNTAILRLVTDESTTQYGFEIDRIAFRKKK